jgi:TonB family protein
MNTAVARGTWEGQVVDGKFPLFEWLGGTEQSDVFRTELAGRKAAIKLMQADAADAGQRISQWRVASKLSHPHLLSIFDAGKCTINGNQLLYVVTELAEEDLSQVLPVRPLSTKEAGEMLPPVISALGYLHGKGLVHGRLKPSNILAAENQLKISSDGVRLRAERLPGKSSSENAEKSSSENSERSSSEYEPPEIANGTVSPAADVWSLGMTVLAALGKPAQFGHGAPANGPDVDVSVPAPFRQIARECLRVNPAERCSLDQITRRLQSPPTSAQIARVASRDQAQSRDDAEPERRSKPKTTILAVVAVLLLLAGFFAVRAMRHNSNSGETTTQSSQAPAAQVAPSASEVAATPPQTMASNVVQQDIPNVPLSARNTIQGKIKVAVRVAVDNAGNVSDATLVTPGPSKYFARLALESSRKWKFSPAENNRAANSWILRFRFGRAGTEVTPTAAP